VRIIARLCRVAFLACPKRFVKRAQVLEDLHCGGALICDRGTPILCEAPSCCGGEDGLAEAPQDFVDAGQAFASSVSLRQQRLDLMCDAPLFG
jgi:hypothetical protein